MAEVISILIQAKDQASQAIKAVGEEITGASKAAAASESIVTKVQKSWGSFAAVTATAGVATHTLVGEIQESTDASNKLQASLTGLSSVATHFGQDAGAARKAAQSLAKDGLMTVADAATGLKNLLAAGFSLDQAITLMNRFKDSAAFGRQASLKFGEAISSATEGIKNGNSILVDNAGVTKNLSIMLEEAGYSAQDLMRASSDAGVRQAIFNGIVRETNAQVGDAQKLTNSYAGQQAKLSAQTEILRAKLGMALQPVLAGITEKITPIVTGLGRWISTHQALTAALVAGVGAILMTVTALGAIGIAIATLTPLVAALGISLGPIGLALGAIGLVAAAVTAHFFKQGQQADALTVAQRNLKQATDELKTAQDSLAQAQLNEEGASLRVEQAQRAYNDAVAQYGPKSLEARDALYQLKQAQMDLTHAQDDTRNSLQQLKDKQVEVARNKELVKDAREKQEAIDGITRAADGAVISINKLATKVSNTNAAGQKIDLSPLLKAGNHATGTSYASGGLTWVGENGPELINLPRGSGVMPNYMARQFGGSGGDTNITISGNITITTPEAADAFWNRIDQTQRLARLGVA